MIDPIEEHGKHGKRLDEIFGWLKRTFGSQAPPATRQSPIQHTDTDKDCSPLGYKMSVGDKLNTKVAGSMGAANVTIGLNTIKNVKGLQFELVDSRGKGTGKFRNAVVRDFKCYDEDKDIYGIKWLFDGRVSYDADSISGQLKANKKNQGVDFKGKWNDGVFFGTFLSDPKDFNGTRGKGAVIFNAPQAKPKVTTKKRKSNKATGKKGRAVTAQASPQATTPPTQTMTTPMTVGTITPTPFSTAPATGAPSAPTPTTTGRKGKPGKKITTESLKGDQAKTIREFLDSFM